MSSLELPVFTEDRELFVSKGQMIQSLNSYPSDTFLRYVRLTGDNDQDVKTRLDTAQREYQDLAQTCGAKLVDFTYGLYPIQTVYQYNNLGHHAIPDDYLLAAEVEVVRSIEKFKLPPKNIWLGISRYRNNKDRKLADSSVRQFRYSSADNSWYLLDIEPRLRPVIDYHDRKYTRP